MSSSADPALRSGATSFMRGGVIDEKYELVREISKGGMGVVYEALHLGTGRRVALKLILAEALGRNDADVLRRFEREARAAGSIDSQHVVQVTDTGLDRATSRPYIAMELLAGEDLRQFIRRCCPLPPDLVSRIGAQVCLGLGRAHERGVVHRDIKSANIYLARQPDAGLVAVKILDFGIAKIAGNSLVLLEQQELTRSGCVLGSPSYMSPEQAIGSRTLDARSDIWSLGVVMYEALCGSTPHGHHTALGALIIAICSTPPVPLHERAPWVPPKLAAIVHRALSFEPSQRFQTAAQMHAELLALLPDEPFIRASMLHAEPSAVMRHQSGVLEIGLLDAERAASNGSIPAAPLELRATGEAATLGEEATHDVTSVATPAKSRVRRWRALVAGALLSGAGACSYALIQTSSANTPAASASSKQLVASQPVERDTPGAPVRASDGQLALASAPAAPNRTPPSRPPRLPARRSTTVTTPNASPPAPAGPSAPIRAPMIDREL